ncbi:MAG: 50S ribosomal protein L28 [Flavobacteriales bacterium]|nr:50S ribosomal protein L28 [Flavobacteriales bacterium]
MSRVCAITKKGILRGNNVSHSNRKTKRIFKPNLQKKTFYLPEEKRYITLKVSAKGLRLIDKIGLKAALQRGGIL